MKKVKKKQIKEDAAVSALAKKALPTHATGADDDMVPDSFDVDIHVMKEDDEMDPEAVQECECADSEEVVQEEAEDEEMEAEGEEVAACDAGMEDEEEAAADEEMDEAARAGIQEHVDALVSGEANLTEEFKGKAKLIFETAVLAQVKSERAKLQEQFERKVEKISEAFTAKLTDRLDSYLNYVVEEYMKENQLAIEQGLQVEIAESFLTGMKDLLHSHNVEVPTVKRDLVEELTAKCTKLENSLNEELKKNLKLHKQSTITEKANDLIALSEGLSKLQVEKLQKLAENVEYVSKEDFEKKIKSLKESYFTAKPKVKADLSATIPVEADELNESELSPVMKAYLNAARAHGVK